MEARTIPVLLTGSLVVVTLAAGWTATGEPAETPPPTAVSVREQALVLPHYVKAVVPGTENEKRPRFESRRAADATYRAVVLENRYLRIQIVPELGGVIYRALFKPTNDDLFYCEELGKEWYVFWESGVKASFTHTFGLARGIGKTSFADERVAVSVEFGAPAGCVGAVTWRPGSGGFAPTRRYCGASPPADRPVLMRKRPWTAARLRPQNNSLRRTDDTMMVLIRD